MPRKRHVLALLVEAEPALPSAVWNHVSPTPRVNL